MADNHRVPNVSVEEIHGYVREVKQWMENVQVNVGEGQYVVERNVTVARFWEDNMYRNLGYITHTVPPLWKRVAAEVIDILILFAMKLYITFIVFYNLDIPVPDKSNFITFLDNPKNAIVMTTEVALLELLYRLVACFYESYCLHGEEAGTPGKLCMGLKVIYVDQIVEVDIPPSNSIRVYPGSRLSWELSIWRAFLKNIFLVLMIFPMVFGFPVFKHNRTGYDLLVGTIVVESRGREDEPNLHAD